MQNHIATLEDERGFSFRNCKRNNQLIASGFIPPKMIKTGTTICGIIYKDGVILGCDTRTTKTPIICEKKCEKIYKIQENIFCAGAGSAGDMEAMVKWMRSNSEMHRLNTNRKFIPVEYVVTITKRFFFEHAGNISCVFIVGGVDFSGPKIYEIHSHGSIMRLPYATMGSGTFAAMAFIETRWKPDMTEAEAKELVADAVTAGVTNDLGSGTNVDICVVRKSKSEKLWGYRNICESGQKLLDYTVKPGTTAVLSTLVKHIEIEIVEEKVEKMDCK